MILNAFVSFLPVKHILKSDSSKSSAANNLHYTVICCNLIFCKSVFFLSQNAIISFLIGLSFLIGGIVNLVYYIDNNTLWSDVCSAFPDYDFINTPKVCQDLLLVRNTEIACAVS